MEKSRRQRTTPRQARRAAARNVARPSHGQRIVAQPAPSKGRPAAPLRPAMARNIEWSGATTGGAICATSARPIGRIDSVFKTEYYDLKNHFSEPQCKMTVLPLNSVKSRIGYPRMSASGESSTTMHRLLHASGSHPIPPPDDPKTNQYNQDLGLIHSINGNHLEIPNEGSSIDHQVTIYLHAQNITMFPTNETCSTVQRYTLLSNILIALENPKLLNSLPSHSNSIVLGGIYQNSKNPNHNDSAGYHDSVTILDSEHGDSTGKLRLSDYQLVCTAAHTRCTDYTQPASILVTQNDVMLTPDLDNPEPFHTKSQTDPVHAALPAHSHGVFLSSSGLNYSNLPTSKADFNEHYSQLDDSDSLKTELSKLKTENESLISKSNELTSENDRINQVMSSWAKSSISLGKLHEVQKPFNDKTGLGFSFSESISSDTSTQSDLADDKLKNMSFVKASMIHDTLESVKYDDQNVSKLNQKVKSGIGYFEPNNSKPSWLKNRLDKDRAKAGSQSSNMHQQRHSSVKVRKHKSSSAQTP
ncbi:hypothetical protein F511_21622 [Dorcoceras hygrometricum]|uniref:Uncharacterized protein n=1 Tax=Dorcoceras hygrometricum TaxID=472368 RepID=A0A2Z7D7Y6_9LAMI|nr:hypothetical protein F511_21622 [Dorcoceras hygrometricum]